jgi:hypothetical protein
MPGRARRFFIGPPARSVRFFEVFLSESVMCGARPRNKEQRQKKGKLKGLYTQKSQQFCAKSRAQGCVDECAACTYTTCYMYTCSTQHARTTHRMPRWAGLHRGAQAPVRDYEPHRLRCVGQGLKGPDGASWTESRSFTIRGEGGWREKTNATEFVLVQYAGTPDGGKQALQLRCKCKGAGEFVVCGRVTCDVRGFFCYGHSRTGMPS